MKQEDTKQIIIDGHLISISGLKDAIATIAQNHAAKSDSEIQELLLHTISANNYIASAAAQSYGRALLREYKLAQGMPVADEQITGLSILVLGMGCARCNELESDVRNILAEMKIAAALRHITDFKEIAKYGIMGSPALVINNKVVSVGEVPPKSKIRQWIIEAYQTPA